MKAELGFQYDTQNLGFSLTLSIPSRKTTEGLRALKYLFMVKTQVSDLLVLTCIFKPFLIALGFFQICA